MSKTAIKKTVYAPPKATKRGYFGIGMWEPKIEDNLGTLLRSAFCFGADYVFTVGNRYKKQYTDTGDTTRNVPLFHYLDMDDFFAHVPAKAEVVGVEIVPEAEYMESLQVHPRQAVYILGGEDRSLPLEITSKCDKVLKLDTNYCLNVASTGSIVMYDRQLKERLRREYVRSHETIPSLRVSKGRRVRCHD